MKFLEDLVRLLAGEVDTVPVCALPEAMANAIGAKTQFVYLSSQTVHKQRQCHSDLAALDYLMLPNHMSDGLVLLESQQRLRLHFCYERAEGQRYIATVKATKDGRRMYVVRYHKARRKQTKSLLKRCEVLRNHKT